MKFQIAKVNKTLIAVSKLTKAGHKVFLEASNPRIECKSGEVITLRHTGGVFILDMWYRKSDTGAKRTGFTRQ